MVYTGETKLFTDEELSLIDECWNSDRLVNKDHLKGRAYDSVAIENKSTISKLVEWFNSLKIEKITRNPKDLILHRFYKGHYFGKHTDDYMRNGSKRKYLIGVALNDNFKGGKFHTYNPDKVTIGTEVGVPYAIKTDVLHEVTEVTEGVRKTAFIFVSYNNFLNNVI